MTFKGKGTALLSTGLLLSGLSFGGTVVRGFVTGAATRSSYAGIYDNTVSEDVTFRHDSRVGVSVNGDITDELSAGALMTARASSLESYQPTFDWALITWKPMNRMSLRVGRLLTPVWMFSEQIDVGLTFPWVRLPTEVYAMNSFKSFEGASLSWGLPLGGMDLTLTAYAGQGSLREGNPLSSFITVASINALRGLELAWANDFAQLRLAYLHGRVEQLEARGPVPASVVIPGVPPNLNFVNITTFDAKMGDFVSAGVKFDRWNLLLIWEYAYRYVTGADLTKQAGTYGTLGYHLDKFLPHLTYSWSGKNAGTRTGTEQTVTAGLAWQALTSATLKLEYQYSKSGDSTVSFDLPNQHAHFVNAALDVVF